MSENFVSFNVMGGLGNILFPAAAAYSYSINNNYELKTNDKHSGYLHTQPEVYLNSIFKNFKRIKANDFSTIYKEKKFSFDPVPTNKKANIFLSGYFQSEKYFKKNKSKVRSLFLSDTNRINTAKKIFNSFFKESDSIVSIHIRRGSYLHLKNNHTNLDLQYYTQALKLIKHDKVLVFSDDLKYCKNVFLGKKYFFHCSEDDLIDLYLMSFCNDNVIANSTYSWWGAWLNNNENKRIITPTNWFGPANSHLDTKDLIPENWIKI